ncbi:unnamed protein product [Clavelina lepadiformis]|uniref:Uncharacterized protein n=1 Tax=Clavelina lepadiformis TaxID=159417 RepID=A0ABP0H264_CLALP
MRLSLTDGRKELFEFSYDDLIQQAKKDNFRTIFTKACHAKALPAHSSYRQRSRDLRLASDVHGTHSSLINLGKSTRFKLWIRTCIENNVELCALHDELCLEKLELSEFECQKLFSIISSYRDVFSLHPYDIGQTEQVEHSIETGDSLLIAPKTFVGIPKAKD